MHLGERPGTTSSRSGSVDRFPWRVPEWAFEETRQQAPAGVCRWGLVRVGARSVEAGQYAEARFRLLRRRYRQWVLPRAAVLLVPLTIAGVALSVVGHGTVLWCGGFLVGGSFVLWLYAADSVPVNVERWGAGAAGSGAPSGSTPSGSCVPRSHGWFGWQRAAGQSAKSPQDVQFCPQTAVKDQPQNRRSRRVSDVSQARSNTPKTFRFNV